MYLKMSFTVAVLLCHLYIYVSAQDTLTFRISEEQPTRTKVGNIIDAAGLATEYSADVLRGLQFRFRAPDPLFEIIESTGVIQTRRVIDREALPDCMYRETCLVSQEVRVTPYAYFRVIPIAIQIDDINDHAPKFPQSRLTLAVSENVAVNTSFSIPTAEDPDAGSFGIQSYELITPTDMFGIKILALPDGSKDLSIVVLKVLDRESENFYSIQIRAVDGGSPSKSGTVTVDISVDDSNDNSPVFDKLFYEAQIYENLDIDTPVIQVHANDLDDGSNGVVYYTFDAHTAADYGSFFGIHNGSGLIFVRGNIDYETHKSFHLNVVANDLGRNSVPDYTKVNIAIMDINDNAPEISVNTFTDNQIARIPENSEPGHTIAYVGVSDPDSGRGGNVTCQIDNANFRIQQRPNSGTEGFEIVSAKSFDREIQQDYIVVVRCEDHGSPPQTSSVRLSIKVMDENDNTPYFRPNSDLFAVSVNENNKIGDIIIKMNTSDDDIMQNAAVRYSMEAIGDTPENAIAVDLITGVITAKMEFDFETRDLYQFRVIATDQGDPPRYAVTTLTLNIIDQNDGFPYFLKPSYSFEVLENQIAGTDVGTITALDNDSPPFNEVIYGLEPIRDSYKFQIDANSGKISTATILDREELAVYNLVGVASNLGMPRVRTTVNVTVYIGDENDNAPVMIFPTESNDTIQVPTRMSVGYHVVQIEAADPDYETNGQLNYAISSGNNDNLFSIDRDTGAISAAQAISETNLRRQTLILKVMDNGEPERRTFMRLNIVFNQSVAVIGASAGALVGQDTLIILIVAAVGGCVVIVIIIALAICCVRRSRDRKNKKEHVYNCRTEEAKKALSSQDSRGSTSSDTSDKSIDTCLGKTKDKAKKEVTFSVDMDDNWPLQGEKTAIEKLHAQQIVPSDCHPNAYPMPPERGRAAPLAATAPQPTECPRSRPVARQPSCCACQKHGDHRPHPSLTQHNLEAFEYNNILWHNSVDRDSESGCSGTDSGRGNSEEGECVHNNELNHSHEQCGHGPCCCSSGIYAKRYNTHLQPPAHHSYGQCHNALRECSCCGPANVHHPLAQDHHNAPCELHNVSPTHHCGAMDECTPLEALPPFSKPHFRDRFYAGKTLRFNECPNSRAMRQRHSLDGEDMTRRQYGFAPSMPSLNDRHTPSPTFTSASDSQFYPYTGAHSNQRGLYSPCANKTSSFMPIAMKKSPSREESVMAASDDGTTTSGSYSLENLDHQDQVKVTALGTPVTDCYV